MPFLGDGLARERREWKASNSAWRARRLL